MSNLLDNVNCTGCTACMSICPRQCIDMKKDNNGFTYPIIANPSLCINCGACNLICPVSNKNNYTNINLPIAYAAFSINEAMRMESSSGGIFSEIANVILEKGGVVYGAAYNKAFDVYHYCVDNPEELYKIRGAKYTESDLKNTFSEILKRIKNGQYVLFSGTPCQVAGLKSFVKKDYENLICIDFVCHGVPSPMVWKEYIKYRSMEDVNGGKPIRINLRAKNTGWSQYQYSNVFEYANGKQHSALSSQSLFMKLFVGDYISRLSCENCKFKGYSRVSDITLGDFWGIWDIDPEMDDNKGTSVVLIQSEKGKRLWEEIKGKIKYKQVTLEQASQYNPSMLVASKAKQNREDVLERIRTGKISSCEELFVQKAPSFSDRVKGKISRVVHSIMNK